jgi:hypothetical protein
MNDRPPCPNRLEAELLSGAAGIKWRNHMNVHELQGGGRYSWETLILSRPHIAESDAQLLAHRHADCSAAAVGCDGDDASGAACNTTDQCQSCQRTRSTKTEGGQHCVDNSRELPLNAHVRSGRDARGHLTLIRQQSVDYRSSIMQQIVDKDSSPSPPNLHRDLAPWSEGATAPALPACTLDRAAG